MVTRSPIAVLATLLLFSPLALSAQEKPKKEAKVCTLTKKKVEKGCCCEQREGKLYCTLAKKTVEKCCCRSEQKPAPELQ